MREQSVLDSTAKGQALQSAELGDRVQIGNTPFMQTTILRVSAATVLIVASGFGQTERARSFPLSNVDGLVMAGKVKAEAVEYQGRKAVRLAYDGSGDGLAILPDTDFQDGVIEADVALRVTTPAGVRNPGFIGIAFRARPNASHYDLFYLRPGNANAGDQAMRNHAVQYVAEPGFSWYKLRREWPWIYESHIDLKPETWTTVRIEVAGRAAKIYVNGSANPALIVEGLKGEDLHGAVALWGSPNQESYFSNVRITPAAPQKLQNGADISGAWDLHYAGDVGAFDGSLRLKREGSKVTGSWSGGLAQDSAVTGTWRDGYVELSFAGEWPKDIGLGEPGAVTVILAGWIDGNTGGGRMRVEGHSDGRWAATRKQ